MNNPITKKSEPETTAAIVAFLNHQITIGSRLAHFPEMVEHIEEIKRWIAFLSTPSADLAREIRNHITTTGTLDFTFQQILASRSPDETFNLLGGLVDATIATTQRMINSAQEAQAPVSSHIGRNDAVFVNLPSSITASNPVKAACVECGDSVMPHDPGICGNCYAMKYRDSTPSMSSGLRAWYCPASGGFWLSEESIPPHIKALGVEALGKIVQPNADAIEVIATAADYQGSATEGQSDSYHRGYMRGRRDAATAVRALKG